MSSSSNIEWTDATWNPVRGCTRVSPGCGGPKKEGGCYAERMAARFSKRGQPFHGFAEMRGGEPRWTGKLALIEKQLTLPLHWKKPRRIFVNSMSDLFHESLPDEAIDKAFAVMALCPQHTFQVLTKRAERMRDYFAAVEHDPPGKSLHAPELASVSDEQWHAAIERGWPLDKVWLGVSCERQQEADERIPLLLQTPAAIRFISAEPLLGPIDLYQHIRHSIGCANCGDGQGDGRCCDEPLIVELSALDWVIVGGESGPDARPMHPQWARDIRDQCQAAGVPFFFKQFGEWAPGENGDWPPTRTERVADWFNGAWHYSELSPRVSAETHDEQLLYRLGKKAAGRLLDGVEHSDFPEIQA